jgi:ligand-binding sensor domain-containing protein
VIVRVVVMVLLAISCATAQHVPERVYGTADGLAHQRVTALEQDDRGFLWIGSEGGLDRFDGQTFTSFSRIGGKPLGAVRSIERDGLHLRVRTETGEARLLIDPHGRDRFESGALRPSTHTDTSLAPEAVTLRDHEGNVWRATRRGLAMRRSGRAVCLLAGRELPAALRAVTAVAEAGDGAIWLATRGAGVLRLDRADSSRITVLAGLPSQDVTAVLPLGPDYVLVGTESGLLLRQGRRTHMFTTAQGLPSDTIRALVASPRGGGVWIATAGGLVRWDGSNLRTFTTREGLPSNDILAIAEDPFGDIWVGTGAGACTIVSSAQFAVRPVEATGTDRVTSVYIDGSGRPWFGCEGRGVVHLSATGLLGVEADDGLAGRGVVFITEDSTGTMYFGTNAGVSVLPGRNRMHFETGGPRWRLGVPDPVVKAFQRRISIYTLTTANSLHGDEMLSGAVLRASDGGLWFGGSGGVTRYAPSPVVTYPRAMVLLVGLQIGDTATTPARAISLSHDNAIFAVRCVLPSFTNAGQVRYHFRLDGHEYLWHESPDGRMLYTGIPPGSYRLVVRATTGEGAWSTEQTVLAVEVAAPLHERWWMQVLALALAVAAGWFAHVRRVRRAA